MRRNLMFAIYTAALLWTVQAMAQPRLVLNTSLVDFGNVTVGQTATRTLLLTNGGTDTLRIADINSAGPQFVAYPKTMTIPPGGSFIDTLRFTPASSGKATADLTIASNDPDSPTLIPVTGFGLGGGVVDSKTQAYRDDRLGDVQFRKEGVMDGNLVVTLFNNNGEVGHWPFQPSCVWPKGTDHSYLDGVALLVGAKLVAPGNGKVITPIESAYREEVDRDPVTGEEWVLQPVPGYVEPSSTRPAVNRDPSTFPPV